MGKVVADFIKSRPLIRRAERTVTLPVSADEFYKDPAPHNRVMYERFGRL